MIDFEKTFDDFCNTNTEGTNYIKEIKSIFNKIDNTQLQLIHQLRYYGQKWECTDLLFFADKYLEDISIKGIDQGLFGTNLRACIKAYSLEEFLGKINSSSVKKVE